MEIIIGLVLIVIGMIGDLFFHRPYNPHFSTILHGRNYDIPHALFATIGYIGMFILAFNISYQLFFIK